VSALAAESQAEFLRDGRLGRSGVFTLAIERKLLLRCAFVPDCHELVEPVP
jgi:hypothetical protein